MPTDKLMQAQRATGRQSAILINSCAVAFARICPKGVSNYVKIFACLGLVGGIRLDRFFLQLPLNEESDLVV